jgi:hypothetical protein
MKPYMFLTGAVIVAFAAVLPSYQPAAVRAGDEKTITIPLEKVYMTSEQKGQNKNWGDSLKNCQQQYDELEIGKAGMGASNLFLVNADSLSDAIIGTLRVHGLGFGVDAQIKPDEEKARQNSWLVVYLGCRPSAGPMWLAQGVEIKDHTIRFVYSAPKPTIRGYIWNKYFYWVDLGALKPGAYSLELFDEGQKVVTLTRRVKVATKN